MTNSVVELLPGANSQVHYLHLQNLAVTTWNFSTQRMLLTRDSLLRYFIGSWGSKLSKNWINMELNGPGSHGELLGLYFPGGRQHLDHHTNQLHKAPSATSDLLFKGALKDRARSVYQGFVKVYPQAQKTNAYQANRNLMLSKLARADSIPGLEIEADDVRCTHGATAGQIPDEYVFYLMARGHRPRQRRTHDRPGFPGGSDRSDSGRGGAEQAGDGDRTEVGVMTSRQVDKDVLLVSLFPCFPRMERTMMTDPNKGYVYPNKLVSTQWVAEHLNDPKVRIVESNEDIMLYPRGHVPGAVQIDWVGDLNDPITRDYLNREQFEHLMARNGITNDTFVVFYGDKSNWWACYALWIFELFGHTNTAVMDGGRLKWEKEGRPLIKDVPAMPIMEYHAARPHRLQDSRLSR